MKRFACAVLFLLAFAGAGWSLLQVSGPGPAMTEAANKFLETLSDEEKRTALMPYETPQRLDWHFIPKDERKGLQIKNMNERQRAAAHDLLRASLSEIGYDKTKKIMALEAILHELEKNRRNGSIRDPERYYMTIFGKPSEQGRWGLSFEGHHLSLNFVVQAGRVVASTPAFFGANPAIVKTKTEGGLPLGTRVLAREETLAFQLLKSLSDEQKDAAVLADTARREIRAAGEPQPPQEPPVGIAASMLTDQQKKTLQSLIRTYASHMPKEVAQRRLQAIEQAGFDKAHFAWMGPERPGIGHYYRVQGPTFLIEFVNTQPDPAGNPANHIHCVWRDMEGDFAVRVEN